ncbi:hypothetical protein EGW08_015868 [Elysia chlorotica]|uniref:Cytosolic fatty-acid binding proteins domain-containing protein n=1 Tax=Elysia chlorotica TaxID=188477 RepID=A0A433T4A8_ELYCH|nr:hypothetical protein EGW08_015868 [Elysia chlorotica]
MTEENKSADTEDVLTEEEKEALAAIKEKFGGKWKEVRNENVDGFFTEMGVNFFLRKLVSLAKPEMETVASYENDKLVSKATPCPGTTGKPAVVTREISPEGELITTFEVNQVVCKRFFTKLS